MKPGDVLLTIMPQADDITNPDSLSRLIAGSAFNGRIGSVTEARHKRLLSALATFLHNAA